MPRGPVPKPCLDCGIPALRNRCAACEQAHQYRRNRLPHRSLYRDLNYLNASKTGICHICKQPGADTRDHVIPVIAGGTNAPENIRPAHRSCNSAKGSSSHY